MATLYYFKEHTVWAWATVSDDKKEAQHIYERLCHHAFISFISYTSELLSTLDDWRAWIVNSLSDQDLLHIKCVDDSVQVVKQEQDGWGAYYGTPASTEVRKLAQTAGQAEQAEQARRALVEWASDKEHGLTDARLSALVKPAILFLKMMCD